MGGRGWRLGGVYLAGLFALGSKAQSVTERLLPRRSPAETAQRTKRSHPQQGRCALPLCPSPVDAAPPLKKPAERLKDAPKIVEKKRVLFHLLAVSAAPGAVFSA